MSNSLETALALARERHDHYLAELQDFLRIPSISSDSGHQADLEQAAAWLAQRLQKMGLEKVEVQSTGGNPVVFGEMMAADPAAPTVLIYGHYDVQSPAPLEDWESEPFEPVIQGENIFARGATDMKGQTMACLAALESVIQAGPIPTSVKFLLEGEEEIGSPSLPDYLATHREELASDFSLNPDAGMISRDIPTIAYSLRGMAACRLIVRGPVKDLHSGIFGGVVHNPIHALAELIAGMHDDHGRVTLPGFYDKVRPLDEEERAEMARLPTGEAFFLAETGAPALWGEPEYTPVERTGARPTLEVNYIAGGEPKSAIPAETRAGITMRLVPDQDPQEALQQLRRYLQENAPPTITWELQAAGGSPAALTDRHHPAVESMSLALEAVWGRSPAYQRVGGGIPVVVQLQEVLGIDSVLTGFSVMTEDNLHGPNEKLHLPTWQKGIQALIHFLYILGDRQSKFATQ